MIQTKNLTSFLDAAWKHGLFRNKKVPPVSKEMEPLDCGMVYGFKKPDLKTLWQLSELSLLTPTKTCIDVKWRPTYHHHPKDYAR